MASSMEGKDTEQEENRAIRNLLSRLKSTVLGDMLSKADDEYNKLQDCVLQLETHYKDMYKWYEKSGMKKEFDTLTKSQKDQARGILEVIRVAKNFQIGNEDEILKLTEQAKEELFSLIDAYYLLEMLKGEDGQKTKTIETEETQKVRSKGSRDRARFDGMEHTEDSEKDQSYNPYTHDRVPTSNWKPQKELMKHGSPPPQQIDRRIDPNTIRMKTLWEFLSEKENMSALRISDQTAKLAREKYQELKSAWETILNMEDRKVRDFLNSRGYIQKRSLSSLKIDAKDPLHKVMMQLSDAKRIFSHKDDIIYEYVTLVDVCNTFRHLAAHTTKHVQSEAPSEKHLKTPAKLKSVERTGPQESDVDCRSHLENLLHTYLEDKNVDEDDKERSRQEFMNLVTLREKYGTTDDHVSKDDQVEEDKLENLVTEDQRGQAKDLYAVLGYAKEKGLKGWHWAAAEFSRLTDFVKGLRKTEEDHGARPKIPSQEAKQTPFYQLISSCKESDPTLRRKALDQYNKLRRRAKDLPDIRAKQNLHVAQSTSRLRSPADIPDDEQSSSYHVLQILRAADPDAKKYSAAWEEYFCLLAEEQRFIQIISAKEEYKHREHNFQHQAPNAQEPFQNLDFDNQVQLPPADQAAGMSSFVQAPCERQPQRNLGKEGLISMPVTQWKAVLDEIDRKTQEVEDLSSRLSCFASQQLTRGNPNIADLSDCNRPTKSGEMFSQFYDTESTRNVTNETMSASPKSDKVGTKEMNKSRQERDHAMRRELSGDRSNEKETVIQDDHLSKSQKQSSRREDESRQDDNRSLCDFNDGEDIDVKKDIHATSCVREKKKEVAENIKKSTQMLVEKGGEEDGVESKRDIPDEDSKEQAEQNINMFKVKEHNDKENGKCEGAEGGKDEKSKKMEEDDSSVKGVHVSIYEKEKVIQDDSLSKSKNTSSRRTNESRPDDNRSGDILNHDEGIDLNKDVDATSSVSEKKKRNTQKSVLTLLEKGGERNGEESKQNSKEKAEIIKLKVHNDKESGTCKGAEGRKDEKSKKVEEEEEDDFSVKKLHAEQNIKVIEDNDKESGKYEGEEERKDEERKKVEGKEEDGFNVKEEQADPNTIFHDPSSSEQTTSLHRKAQALTAQDDWNNCLNEDHGLAEWKCINCDDFFCLPCKNIHTKGTKSRRHRLLHISERETEDAVRSEIFCTFHENRELDMYCITDKRVICTLCTVTATHRYHETEALDTYAKKIRSSVGFAVTSADKIFPRFEERMENLNREFLNAKKMSTMNRQHIESSKQEAVAKIKQNAANLLAEDERKMHILETSVTREVDDLRGRMTEARSIILESRNFLESCSDPDLIKQAEVYIGKLDTIKEPKGKSDSDYIVHKMSGDEIQGELSKGLFSK